MTTQSCIDIGPQPSFGVTRSETNTLVVLYKPCHGTTRIYSIQVEDMTRSPRQLIWRAESTSGTLDRTFEIGVAPGGWVETLPLSRGWADLPAEIRISFQTDELSHDYENIPLSEVKPGQLWVSRHQESVEHFLQRDTCG
jgi:hypothetical protein